MLDWAADMLGLAPAFLNSSGVGGGSIQVGTTITHIL